MLSLRLQLAISVLYCGVAAWTFIHSRRIANEAIEESHPSFFELAQLSPQARDLFFAAASILWPASWAAVLYVALPLLKAERALRKARCPARTSTRCGYLTRPEVRAWHRAHCRVSVCTPDDDMNVGQVCDDDRCWRCHLHAHTTDDTCEHDT